MELILENVRSFVKRRSTPLARLTFLTGENSSGKSTFLAMIAAASGREGFPVRPAFDREPYKLGGFDNIATYKGGRNGRAKTFSLGMRHSYKEAKTTAVATYASDNGQTRLSRLHLENEETESEMEFDGQKVKGVFRLIGNVGDRPVVVPFEGPIDVGVEGSLLLFRDQILYRAINATQKMKSFNRALIDRLARIVEVDLPGRLDTVSISPIRSRPKPSYERGSENYSPEGDHIPYLLSNLFQAKSPSQHDRGILRAIDEFGKESGLFRDLKVRRPGGAASDPFQLLVTVAGRSMNIYDVGYGVSQALPVVVQSLAAADRRWILIQQPEVHLHPSAQAALGSFFVNLVGSTQKSFVIETHSDFIIDRVRQEVMAGRIAPADVSILYFEKPELETEIHELGIDSLGNIIGSPPSYREFFLREEMRLWEGTAGETHHHR